jgi:hypothetical protein
MKEISCIAMLAALLLIFAHCKGSKTSIPKDVSDKKTESALRLECDFSATVMVDEGEGCGLLLVLPNGLILQPTGELEDGQSFEDGDRVRISYKVIEDMATSCSKAIAMADITCLKKIEGQSSGECANVRDPFDVEWMKQAVNTLDARKVTRYSYREKRAYMFSGIQETVIYDCFGQELCRYGEGGMEDCMDVISELSNEFVILVVNE